MRKYLVSLCLFLSAVGVSKAEFLGDLLDFRGGGNIGNFLGDAIYKLNAPAEKEVQGSKYYFGGGFSIRAPRKTYRLFYVQPPRISMGCGGIDIAFGAFGYFRPEYLVEFGKAVMQQAPAFAFKTAIEVFCPQCEAIMTKLEQLANLLNSMQLDSCAVAQTLSNYVKDKLKSGSASKDAEAGQTDFYLDKLNNLASNARDLLSGFVNRNLERSEVVRKIKEIRESGGGETLSLVEDIMPKLKDSSSTYTLGSSELLDDADFRKAMKELFGDLEITVPNGEGEITFAPIPPCKKGISNVVKSLVTTGEATACRGDIKITMGGDPIVERVKRLTDEIVNRVLTRQPLDQNHYKFLAMFPFPAYRLINVLSVYPPVLQATGDTLAQYFAYELIKLLILDYYRAYTHALTDLLNSDLITEKSAGVVRTALILASNDVVKEVIEVVEENKKRIRDKLTDGIRLVKTYEQEVAKLMGNDPTYQSLMWSQASGIRAR